MAFRVFLAAILAAALQMGWGFAFWVHLYGVQYMIEKPQNGADADKALTEVLQKELPQSGVYFIPYPEQAAVQETNAQYAEEWKKKKESGPLVEITYRKEGVLAGMPVMMGIGFAHFFVASLLAGMVLAMASGGIGNFPARWLFVFLLGVFAAFSIHLGTPIWFNHPIKAPLVLAGFYVVGWALAGVPLAALVYASKRP
jgi:hypothetical protein